MSDPYREAEEPEPIYVAPRPFDWEGAFPLLLMGGLLVLLIGTGWYGCTHPKPPPSCADLANVPSKDLPARCTKNYDPTK